MKKTNKLLIILAIFTFIILLMSNQSFAMIEGGLSEESIPSLVEIGERLDKINEKSVNHNSLEYYIMRDNEDPNSALRKLAKEILDGAEVAINQISFTSCNWNTATPDSIENYKNYIEGTRADADYVWWRCVAFLVINNKISTYTYHDTSWVLSVMRDYYNQLAADAANRNGKPLISEVMEFLNNKDYDAGNGPSTGITKLANDDSFFCIKHGQAIGKYHGHLDKDHESDADVSGYFTVNSEYTSVTYSTTISNSASADYMDISENNTTKNTKSNVKYFLDTRYGQNYNLAQNIFRIHNGFGEYKTNIFAYSLAYSIKRTTPYHNSSSSAWNYYGNERAQLGLWSVVGNPGNGEPNVSTTETTFDNIDEDNETTGDVDAILGSELYNAGAAVDEYEALLTNKISATYNFNNHVNAVAGTNTALRNNPTVSTYAGTTNSVTSGTDVGTDDSEPTGAIAFQSGSQIYYRIGPFYMNDYALAEAKDVGSNNYISKYSGYGLVYPKIVGGIVSGKITLTNANGGSAKEIVVGNGSGQAKIVYRDFNGNATSKGLSDVSNTYTQTPSESNYPYPYPQSVFYIEIARETCKDSAGSYAANLKDITFEYRQTKTDGTGWVITSKYVQTNWKRQIGASSTEDYSCQSCYNDEVPYYNRSATGNNHNYYCGGSGYCYNGTSGSHRHCGSSCGCSGHTRTGTDSEGNSYTYTVYCSYVSRPYCRHGHYNGEHSPGTCKSWGASHYDTHYHKTLCNNHNHEDCYHTNWAKNSGPTIVSGQPFLAVHDANVTVEKTPVKSTLNVRLTTNVRIDKYIKKVDHVGEAINKFNSTGRKNLFDDAYRTNTQQALFNHRANDTIKLERGDRVTYNIVLSNSSNVNAKVQVKDILPQYCVFESITNTTKEEIITLYCLSSDNSGNGSQRYFITSWIEVAAGSTTTLEVKLIATAANSTYTNENRASLVSGNAGRAIGSDGVTIDDKSTNYVRLTDNRDSGAVINEAQIYAYPNINDPFTELYSADYYTVKEYDVSIEKYIYDVSHENVADARSYDTTYTAGHQRSIVNSFYEMNKSSKPAYVEYGDTITYKIKIYNTTTPYVADRTASPYWSPDCIYVNVRDTLPQEYSALTVDVSNTYEQLTGFVSSSSTGGTLDFYNIRVEADSVTTITVTLVVEEYTRNTIETNAVQLTGNIRNINKGPQETTGVVNNGIYNRCVGQNNSSYTQSSDHYILNDYDSTIDKYIVEYDDSMTVENNEQLITTESNSFDDRYVYTEQEKYDHPIQVEKTEKITYEIKVSNDKNPNVNNSTNKNIASGAKLSTQVRPTKVTDYLQEGLVFESVQASIYTSGNSLVSRYSDDIMVWIHSEGVALDENENRFNVYSFNLGNDVILNPGEYIIYTITVSVKESNMYLYSLENTADLTILTNINAEDELPRQIKNATHNENVSPQQVSSDYVKLKDLVIAGKVWLDRDKDGIMDMNDTNGFDSYIDVEEQPNSHIVYPEGSSEYAMKGITVKLYRVSDTGGEDQVVRVTKTDDTGLFTFGKDENRTWDTYAGTYDVSKKANGVVSTESAQRIPKADNKDANNNYTAASQYIRYYVEYEYDGVLYKSTEVYAGKDNLNNYGEFIVTDGTEYYKIDSNAKELTKVREEFNERYEIVSYNSAYEYDPSVESEAINEKAINYEKDGHVSYLKIDPNRIMKSRSFIYELDLSEIEAAVKTAKVCGGGNWKLCNGYNYGLRHKAAWKILLDADLLNEYSHLEDANGRRKIQGLLDGILEDIRESVREDGTSEVTNYLWLYRIGSNYDKPETDYLKYINLGLEEREDIDISLKKDVYEVKTTINGEEMIYSFDQLDVEGANELNGEMNLNDSNKYLNDYIVKKPYGLTLYESDFRYRHTQYTNPTVRNIAKGASSELNVEVTYKITIDSKSFTDDEPFIAHDQDRELEVEIQEIMDVYDENFIKYKDDPNESILMKEKGEHNVLQDREVKIAEAWYYEDNDTSLEKQYLTLSNTSKYSMNEASKNENGFSQYGYNRLFITGASAVRIKEGENLDIYVKYIIDKADETIDEELIEDVLKIREKSEGKDVPTEIGNIAQINAYSVWYEDTEKPASIVDCDSNAGNLGVDGNGNAVNVEATEYYEDTTYKTGIEFTVKNFNDDKKTSISEISMSETEIRNELNKIDEIQNKYKCTHFHVAYGYAWESGGSVMYLSSECPDCFDTIHYGGHATIQYLYKQGLVEADTRYEVTDLVSILEEYKARLEGKLNDIEEEDEGELIRIISGTVWDDSRSEAESGDNQYHGNGLYSAADNKKTDARMNDNVTENYEGKTEERDIPVRSAKVEYVEIIPVIVDGQIRYYEETLNAEEKDWPSVQNTRTDANGGYVLSGYIPGYYVLRYTYGDDPENVDTLVFNGQDYKSTAYTGVKDSVTNEDAIMVGMEATNQSDARDDEIRRLESMAYSETMVSKKAEVLKSTKESDNDADEYKELTDNTYMEADTVRFYVKPEKLEKLTTLVGRKVDETPYAHLLDDSALENYVYCELDDVVYEDTKVAERTFNISNLDFGIEYRPESQISLTKTISAIKLVTSDGTTLVKLALEKDPDAIGEGINRQHKIIESESIGLEYTQFISNIYNEYAYVDPYKITEEDYQGFIFINVDDEILQGSTIEIEYAFVAENNSEVDRISKNLDDIRFKDNAATQANKEQIRYVRLDGDGTLYSDTENDSNKYVYSASGTARQILYDEYYAEVVVKDEDGNDIVEEFRKYNKTGYTDYYGRYLGKKYYTGNKADTDVVASIKFDKILDYVDTDLVYKSSTESDYLWSSTTDDVLLGTDSARGLFIKKNLFTAENKLANSKGINYVTYQADGKTPITSNLLVSVDDRRKDEDEYSENTDPTVNTGISKFLLPYLTVGRDDSRAEINLITSKVISAETSTDDMQYENLAEVIQYTAQTGRRTNYATTIGNASAAAGEFNTAKSELDASATEVITLTPPTGLDRVNRVIRDVVETTGKGIGFGVVGVALVFAGLVIVRFVIKKIKKRPIK